MRASLSVCVQCWYTGSPPRPSLSLLRVHGPSPCTRYVVHGSLLAPTELPACVALRVLHFVRHVSRWLWIVRVAVTQPWGALCHPPCLPPKRLSSAPGVSGVFSQLLPAFLVSFPVSEAVVSCMALSEVISLWGPGLDSNASRQGILCCLTEAVSGSESSHFFCTIFLYATVAVSFLTVLHTSSPLKRSFQHA